VLEPRQVVVASRHSIGQHPCPKLPALERNVRAAGQRDDALVPFGQDIAEGDRIHPLAGLFLGLPREDQQVACAGHADVEQALVLLGGIGMRRLPHRQGGDLVGDHTFFCAPKAQGQ
jgi:hypothetical protein